MKSFICLALSCLLIGLLYVYVRQQFAAQNSQIMQLTQLVSSMAHEIQHVEPAALKAYDPPLEVKRLPERVTVSDDSESEGDSDEESDDEIEVCPVQKPTQKHEVVSDSEDEIETVDADADLNVNVNVDVDVDVDLNVYVNVEPEEFKNEIIVQEPEEEVSIVLNLSETKTINLFEEMVEPRKVNYDKLTVKELKEMATKLGAPASLKTKKELIDFLEKKK